MVTFYHFLDGWSTVLCVQQVVWRCGQQVVWRCGQRHDEGCPLPAGAGNLDHAVMAADQLTGNRQPQPGAAAAATAALVPAIETIEDMREIIRGNTRTGCS